MLSPRLLAYSEKIVQSGTLLQKYILNWCIENLVPLRFHNDFRSWLVVTYEELIVNPAGVLGLLYDRLSLTDWNRMVRSYRRPSTSSAFVTREKMQHLRTARIPGTRGRTGLIKKWKDRVSNAEEKAAFEVLDRFHIPAYRYGSFLPDDDLLLFPEETLGLHDRQKGEN